ncbi:MAG: hypothetical protein AAB037_01160, partial [Chloroflexota bacterium]
VIIGGLSGFLWQRRGWKVVAITSALIAIAGVALLLTSEATEQSRDVQLVYFYIFQTFTTSSQDFLGTLVLTVAIVALGSLFLGRLIGPRLLKGQAVSSTGTARAAQMGFTRGALLSALGISLVGTVILGALLFTVLSKNTWWLAVSSGISLVGAGAYLGFRSKETEPLYGTLLAILNFGVAAVFLFGGKLMEMAMLEDPLPGMGKGDSTFFFVTPLFMIICGVIGSVIGGSMARKRTT